MEHVRILAERAGIWRPSHDHKTWVRGEYVASPGELAKFADLIVRECINALAAEIVYNENYTERNKVIGDMMIVVKKHFGAEQ